MMNSSQLSTVSTLMTTLAVQIDRVGKEDFGISPKVSMDLPVFDRLRISTGCLWFIPAN